MQIAAEQLQTQTQELQQKLQEANISESLGEVGATVSSGTSAGWGTLSSYLSAAKDSLADMSTTVSEKGISALLPQDDGEFVQELRPGSGQPAAKADGWGEFEDFDEEEPVASGGLAASGGWDDWDDSTVEAGAAAPAVAAKPSSRLGFTEDDGDGDIQLDMDDNWEGNWGSEDVVAAAAPATAEDSGWKDWGDDDGWGTASGGADKKAD